MKKLLTLAFSLALLVIAVTLLCTSCQSAGEGGTENNAISVGTLPQITTEAIQQGTLFVRCSEPEDNKFSIQFVGVVPTNYVDYVGFEACIVYKDGTRGTRQIVKLHTLYRAIEDEEGKPIITSEDFGVEDGYLFVRALDRIPTDEEDLSYEISAYYVVGNKKYYTAKQTFSVQGLLEEHILSTPQNFSYAETSDLIEVQKWVRFESTVKHNDPALSKTYYLGASVPDANGNIKMYACFAVPSIDNNSVGIRYNFTQQEGDYAGVSTALARARTKTLYSRIITENKDEDLTIEDFGLSEGYIAVIPFSENVNILTRQGYLFNLDLHFSRNAVETAIAKEKLEFTEVVEKCVLTKTGVSVSGYTYIPTGYHDWMWFGEEYGNAKGVGKMRIRFTNASNVMGEYVFSMQLAAGVPTRFADRISYVYTAYDKDGNVVGAPNYEVSVGTLYTSIFDNNDKTLTSADFGFERGYIMSMVLNNMKYESDKIASFRLEAYYQKDGQKVQLSSLLIDLETVRKTVNIIQ